MSVPMASGEDDSIYSTLSNFEVEKKIGRGQFSVVYRAKCLANDQIVALKKVQVNKFKILDLILRVLSFDSFMQHDRFLK